MKEVKDDVYKKIHVCPNNHYFYALKKERITKCPFCNEESVKIVEYRVGDCIACGHLCPEYAYGCTDPNPLNI